MAKEYELRRTELSYQWTLTDEPVLVIASGDSIRLGVPMAGHGVIARDRQYASQKWTPGRMVGMIGPIVLDGARNGDSIAVEVVECTLTGWGWCALHPVSGVLDELCREPFAGDIRFFDTAGVAVARLCQGVSIPLRPFLGVMGTHPGGEAPVASTSPHRGGGNIDNRYLTAGSTLFLPVFVAGGRFWCGDPHACQGDGEVGGTALEAPVDVTLRFRLIPGGRAALMFNPGEDWRKERARMSGCGSMAVGPDLRRVVARATYDLVEWLVDARGLGEVDAYMLCTLAGELKILQAVNGGVWTVAATVPEVVFDCDNAARW